jgi:peptidoglycan biosynthesis protein MviN/MurJ (putative lipid II flippase)
MQTQLKGLESGRLLVLMGKLALAGMALVAVCAAGSHWLLPNWPTQTLLIKLAGLLATVIVGAATFAGCSVLLQVEEVKELSDALQRRLKRR